MKYRPEVALYSNIDNILHPSASPVNSTDFYSLNPPLQLWFSLGLRNFARKWWKLRFCKSMFAIFTKANVCCVDFTKKVEICAKSREREFRELPHCAQCALCSTYICTYKPEFDNFFVKSISQCTFSNSWSHDFFFKLCNFCTAK